MYGISQTEGIIIYTDIIKRNLIEFNMKELIKQFGLTYFLGHPDGNFLKSLNLIIKIANKWNREDYNYLEHFRYDGRNH